MGALALFGEKYDDIVRVVQIGQYSKELCGGCHVHNSSEIGLFKIVSESGIGAGVRRIEAITSEHAYRWMQNKIDLFQEATTLLKTKESHILERIQSLYEDMKNLKKDNDSLQAKLANQEIDELLNKTVYVEDVQVLAEQVSVKDMNQLRNMVDELKQKIESSVILLVTENKDRKSTRLNSSHVAISYAVFCL